jgi:hypothetical protein
MRIRQAAGSVLRAGHLLGDAMDLADRAPLELSLA